jgi:hypothetical protein
VTTMRILHMCAERESSVVVEVTGTGLQNIVYGMPVFAGIA